MARKQFKAEPTGRTVLVVDDNAEYLQTTERLVAREGHRVISVEDPAKGLEILRSERIDLVLVDFFMPRMTGEDFVVELRRFNPLVQVILQTGYASEQPPRDLLKRLDIQGYYDKSEGPDKLMLWLDVGLKAAFTVQLLEKSRQGLRYILNATPDLHRLQPLHDLLQGILVQTTGLLGAVDAFLAVLAPAPPPGDAAKTEGFVAVMEDGVELVVRAGTGRFLAQDRVEQCLPASSMSRLKEALGEAQTRIIDTATAVPLNVGGVALGVIYLDRPISEPRDIELLEVFANQAAVAIHNAQLHEMAALDPLTGVYTRAFFQQAFLRELRNAHRTGKPLSLVMVDIDEMKRINDSGGHLRGDEALAATGRVLRNATRLTDSVGRYGGDEFILILPGTTAEGAEAIVQRILAGLENLHLDTQAGRFQVRASVGMSVLQPPHVDAVTPPLPRSSEVFTTLARDLTRRADESLYSAKRAGRGRAAAPLPLTWPPASLAPRSRPSGNAPAPVRKNEDAV